LERLGHGPGFPPDFGSGTALSIINVSAGSGGQCSSSFVYVTPGDLGGSLLYWKVSNPVCGIKWLGDRLGSHFEGTWRTVVYRTMIGCFIGFGLKIKL